MRESLATNAAVDPAARVFAGHGEMRALCRAFDWASTALGPVEVWPVSLRTTVSTLLGSRHPMFLFWGPELIQIYNDAYRPSLGADGTESGRHPRALGMPGREFWTDIWDTIGPQIEQVMATGEATWHEDQYLPIERDGRLDDVWWTYGYGPAHDDDGNVNGVLVVCQETTQRVQAERRLKQAADDAARARRRAERIVEQVADEHLVMDAEFRILTINRAAQDALGRPREALVGLTYWEAFPASAGTEVERRYRHIVETGEEEHFTYHYVGEGYDRNLEIDAYPTDEGGVAIFWRDISERVRAEQALRESGERLRAIYDGTYEYIGLISPAGVVLDCNRASLEFVGNRREDVIGRSFWETPWFRYTPGAPELLRQGVRQAAAGEFVRYEATLQRPSGPPLTFDFSLHPVMNAAGEVVFIVPEGRDITERKRAEEALRENDARYRTLFESMDEAFCVIEVLFDDHGTACDYRFLDTNPAFELQTGLQNVQGRRIRELVPAHESHWFEIYERVALTGEPIRVDAAARGLDRWFDLYAFRIGRPDEHRVAVLFKDVSAARAAAAEREQLLGELRLERARLAEVFQQAPSFLAVMRGPDHVFELVNDAFYAVVGARELVGRRVIDALPELEGQAFIAPLDRVLTTGEPYVGREMPILLARTPGAEPEQRFVDFVYEPLTEADGTRSGVAAHGHDVTGQVIARREIERLLVDSENARAEAEAANRAKAQFLTHMSHELRTPLNAIGGYTELLQMAIRGPLTDDQRHFLDRIQQSQRHLLGLINEVLNFARLEGGSVHYDVVNVEVRALLVAAETLVAPQAEVKGLDVAIADCPDALTARADAEKACQILVNLLSNAVKFTDRGGRIDVSTSSVEGRVRIDVRDTGIGIPNDKLDVIFDPFVQVRADLTRPYEGTGLGLAISRDLARGMGGDLTVESTPGGGSVFTLWLPAA